MLLSFVKTEEDFQDLLALCTDYYHCLDRDEEELKISKMLQDRSEKALEEEFDPRDPDVSKIKIHF